MFSKAQATATAARQMLQTSFDPDLVFVAFDQVDGAGHGSGWSSEEYQQAIENIDGLIDDILTTIENRPNFENEYWQIIVTSDHGHRPEGGHGGQSSLERTIPFVISSRTLRQGALGDGVSHADIAPSVMEHFGIEIPAHVVGLSRAQGAVATVNILEMDDFENLPLQPFAVANGGDGTDWTNQIRVGSPTEWTIDNSQMSGTTTEPAYFGWNAMDVSSWVNEQGVQIGRSSLGSSANNTALVADPDAWDDFASGAAQPGFNSFASRIFDLSGIGDNSFELAFDYEFAAEDTQHGTAELSFDGGTTWQTLLDFDSTTIPANSVFSGRGRFIAGTDFEATSDQMLFRLGCFDASNDWWFAIDNVAIQTVNELLTPIDQFVVVKGEHVEGAVEQLASSDDEDVTVQRNPASTSGEIIVELETTSAVSQPSQLDLRFESAGFFRSEIVQTIKFFDFEAEEFVFADQRSLSRFTDQIITASAQGDLERFVEPITGKLRARVEFSSTAQRQSFRVSIDQATWTIE